MKKILLITWFLIAITASQISAETRFNIKFDITDALVPQPRGSANYTGIEGEFEFNWHASAPNKHIGTQTQASQTQTNQTQSAQTQSAQTQSSQTQTAQTQASKPQASQTQVSQTQPARPGRLHRLSRYLPDFALGFRKENTLVSEGDFLYIRLFRKVGSYRKFDFYPSLALVYGVPLSGQFSATKFNADRTQYESIFLVHNVTTFLNNGIKKNGVLYPELTLGIRKEFHGFNIDLVPGIRILKFGILKSGGFYAPSDFKTKIVLCPTIGIRLGLRI